MLIVKIFYALMFILAGGAIIKYRKVLKGWTGNFVWAERYIGRGGTYFAIILFGLFLIFLGVIYPFGGLSTLSGGDTQNSVLGDRPAE